VIGRCFSTKQAAFALAAGAAFFVAACQLGIHRPVPVNTDRVGLLILGKAYDRQGQTKKALEAYRAFLKDAPKNEKTARVLRRMADIYLKLNQPAKALTVLEAICEDYPGLPWLVGVRYDKAVILSRIGEHKRSAGEAVLWLKRYSHHPLKRDVYILIGDDCHAMGDKAEAFHWWLMAKTLWEGPSEERAALHRKLEGLIATSRPVFLRQYARDAEGTPYAPEIYDRLARIYLEAGDLESAEEAAEALIRSTTDHAWVSKGNTVLNRLKEERAVRQGVIGVLLPLSGPFALYGQEVLKGLQLGMDRGADLPGRVGMALVIRNTQGDPEAALAAFEDLNRHRVMAVIGPLSSTAAGVVARKAQETGVPLIALSQREGIVEEGDMIFRNLLTPAQEIEGLLDAAVNRMGLRRFGILYPDNPYGLYCMNLFWDKLEQLGGTVTAVESYEVDQTDFAEEIRNMAGLDEALNSGSLKQNGEPPQGADKDFQEIEKPEPIINFEALFIPDAFQRIVMIVPQLVFHDVRGVQLLGTSAWQSPQLIEMAKDYLQGAVFCSGFVPDARDADVQAFVQTYRKNFKADPDLLAANAYDTIRLLRRILTEKTVRTRGDLANALREFRGFKGVCGNIAFNGRGEAERKPVLLKISGNHLSVLPQ